MATALLLTVCFTSAALADGDTRGWYGGVDGFYSNLRGSSGSVTTTASSSTPGTPGTPGSAGNTCTLPLPLPTLPLPLYTNGCLLTLIGTGTPAVPGTPGTPGTTAGASTTSSASFSFKGGEGGGISFGYAFDNGFRPEIGLTYSKNDIRSITVNGSPAAISDSSLNAERIMGNLWYDISPSDWIVPYIGGGAGMQHSRYSSPGASASANTFTWQLGAGINFWLAPNVAVSLDYRYVDAKTPKFGPDAGGTTLSTDYVAQQAGLGLKYFFGSGTPPPVATAKKVPEVVYTPPPPPEVVQKCTNVPDNIPKKYLAADGCPLDSDGDGVPDYMDECPHTPAGAKVLPNGCALVGDCRTPKAGEAVDAKGCAVNNSFILKGVNFEFDSARLTPNSKVILSQTAETLKAYPEVDVEVAGYTDDVGTAAYNLGLSERRSNAVKDFLAGSGVEAKRMTPVGYGKSEPLVAGTTPEDRAKNRRVELHVKNN
ncbi:MAG: OmpA family protein [Stenotrophobium sp.]